MVTALTLYFDKVAATTVSTDGALASTTGGTLGNTITTIATTSTGYGELASITGLTWAGSGSIGAPSDSGFLWDVTTLENQQFVAGNWAPTVRLQIGGSGVTGTITADLYVLVSKRASGGTKTLQGTCLLSGQTLTTTTTSYTFANTSLAAISFAPGEKVQFNVWANITANTTTGGTPQIKLFAATTAGQGVSTAQIVTPGYQAQTVGIAVTTAGLNLLRDGMSGATNPVITYVAFGTSNATPQTSDTKLGAEVFRKQVTSYSNGANPGELFINMYLAPGESVGTTIQEVGFFGGSSATGVANTGVLLARSLYTHTKVSTESIQFQLDFTV